jgi:hypothetical protein
MEEEEEIKGSDLTGSGTIGLTGSSEEEADEGSKLQSDLDL